MNQRQPVPPLSFSPWRELLQEAFTAAFLTLLGLSLIEELYRGFVSDFINLKVFLMVTIGLGIMTAIVNHQQPRPAPPRRAGHSTTIVITVASLLTAAFVWLKTASFGLMTVPIAVVSGIIVFVFATNFLDNDGEEES